MIKTGERQNVNYEKLVEDLNSMDRAVSQMYRAIDNSDKWLFMEFYKRWNTIKRRVMKNPINDCGHSLSMEIKEAYKKWSK